MSEERATYGEEQPDITDDNWKLAELERLLADKEKELQRARTAINNLLTYDTCKEHREKIGTENWVNVYKERQAFGCVYCTKEKVEEAEEKARELEAACAVMREALEIALHDFDAACMLDQTDVCERALATDAGKEMLERMELLEELVLLTARVGDWVHADRAPSNEELRRATETVKGMLKEVSDA